MAAVTGVFPRPDGEDLASLLWFMAWGRPSDKYSPDLQSL
jgi:hypothetical protein